MSSTSGGKKSPGKTVQGNNQAWLRIGAPAIIVVVVIAVLIIAKATHKSSTSTTTPTTSVSTDVIAKIAAISSATFDTVGTGNLKSLPQKLSGPALTADGKPRVLYIGAEYCPYCAAQRWALVAALARFGSFSNLTETTSSAVDVFPSTPTLSFHGATYASDTISFTGVETATNQVQGNHYGALDTPTDADRQVMAAIDSQGSIPFLDLAGTHAVIGSSFDPGLLKGMTHAQIAAAMQDPNTAIAKSADAAANVFTAILCDATGNKPAAVCSSSGVAAARAKLAG